MWQQPPLRLNAQLQFPIPMLQPPEHQIAGHCAQNGQLGPLVDGRGLFYKPLQGGGRGDDEAAFYGSFSSHPAIPARIKSFFPGFHGTLVLPASDGSGPRAHLVLDDLLAGFVSPTLIDLKMGARTWPPNCPDDYFRKCITKDRASTTVALGFRVAGVQIGDPGADGGFWRPSKAYVKRFDVEDLRRVLRQFVSTNSPTDGEKPDCALAAAVYGGASGVLSQLLDLKDWFEKQTLFHFYSASFLLVYEKNAAAAGAGQQSEKAASEVRLKLVDFAHVEEGNGVIDHNFLGGLCSLIKFLSDVLSDPEGDSWKVKLIETGGVEKNGN